MPRKNDPVREIRQGPVTIQVKAFADGRFGFDYRLPGADRTKVRLKTQEGAEREARDVARMLAAGRPDLLSITPARLSELLAMEQRLKASRSVPEVVAEFVQLKREDAELNTDYVDNLRRYLNRFAEHFAGSIQEVSAAQIEGWLRALGKEARHRNNILSFVGSLFAFARQRGYVPDQTTEAAKVAKLKVRKQHKVTIWTPAELEEVFKAVRPMFVPWVAIGAFAGIRTEEMQPGTRSPKDPLRWEDFDWRRKFVQVRAETAKTGRARIIPLSDNLLEWLTPWHGSTGPVLSGAPEVRNETRRIDDYRKNALRHSFGSYRLAIVKSIAQVAEEMGNSPQVIREDYHTPQAEDMALKWFGIRPA